MPVNKFFPFVAVEDQKNHVFGWSLPGQIQIPLPTGCPEEIIQVYPEKEEDIQLREHCIEYQAQEERKALAILLGSYV